MTPMAPSPAPDTSLLIHSARSLVRLCALRVCARLPHGGLWLLDELISAGNVGLVECAARYDGRVSFESFAKHRIKGAMLDYLRSVDLLTREERRRGDTWNRQHVAIEAATWCASDPNQWRRVEAKVDSMRLLAALKPRLRLALELYYLEGLKLKTIGSRLGVNESRASQIIKDGLDHMRKAAA